VISKVNILIHVCKEFRTNLILFIIPEQDFAAEQRTRGSERETWESN